MRPQLIENGHIYASGGYISYRAKSEALDGAAVFGEVPKRWDSITWVIFEDDRMEYFAVIIKDDSLLKMVEGVIP